MSAKETSISNRGDFKAAARFDVLFIGFLFTILLWVVGFTLAWQSFQYEKQNAIAHTKSVGTRLAHHSALSIRNVDLALIRTTNQFAKNWKGLKDNPIEAHELLATAFAGLDQLKDVVVLDLKGTPIYSYRLDYDGIDQEPAENLMVELFLKPEKRLFIGKVQSRNAIGLGRPIYDYHGSLKGYIIAEILTDYLKKIYQLGVEENQHNFALYGYSGQLFSIPNSYERAYDISSLMKKKTEQVTLLPREQIPAAITSYTKVPDYDLVIATDTPYAQIIEGWYEQTVAYAIIGIIFSILLLWSVYQVQGSLRQLRKENTNRRLAEQSLKKLSLAVEQSPVSVVITDKKGNIEYVNPTFTENTGYGLDEVYGQNPRILQADKANTTDYKDMWDTLAKGGIWRGEFCNKRKDDSIFWESAIISPIKDDQDHTTHYLAVKEDITHRKETAAQLELAAAVFETATEAILVCDSETKIQTVNRSFTDITGYEMEEVIGKTPSILKSGRHDKSFYNEMYSQLLNTGTWAGEIWNRRKNGEIYPQWLSIRAIQDEAGNILRYISLFSDITHRKKTEERILYQANYDALTDLPNRSLFRDRLQRAIIRADREHKKVALLFIDLDRFKHVNDTLGHAAGDLLLQEAARRLTSIVRKSDTVARLGGDEFTIIIQDLDDFRLVETIVEKLLESLALPYELENNVAFVSGSIGITIYPNDASNVTELLKNADAAMYQAKENGRNLSQFFTKEMNDQANERRKLETALHQALEREEFVLHYQPIVDAATGKLVSCEALLRWHQPEHGNVFPDKFIPLAEDTGLIVPIGEWVLMKACREAVIWSKYSDHPPNVSVNMSSRQFQRDNMATLIKNTLKETGLPGERLNLEITESLLVSNDDIILKQLHAIRDMGVALSIDDFGTGYSSLSYLRRFPITTLKIDRAFIFDLTTDPEAAGVVSAILSMAKSLNLKVVGEGVETAEQLFQLREEKCDFIQGYHYSPPVPVEAFRIMVKKKGPLNPDE
ncbi:MAG: EAL domain-containing protein [Methylocystaceae bacterium]|nr:EAL domain-containing protein [Methylocystaceae bacterium]